VVSGGLAAYEGIEIDNAYRNGQITMRQRNQAQAENATGAVGGLAGGLAGAAAGASIGAAGGPVGAAVGGLVGGIAGGIAGDEGGREIGRAATGGNQEELPPKIDTRRLRTGS
jgi:phage tail tape-measure protein